MLAATLVVLAVAPLAALAWQASARQEDLELALERSEAGIAAQRFHERASLVIYSAGITFLRPLRARRMPGVPPAREEFQRLLAAADSVARCHCGPLIRPRYIFRTDFTPSGTVLVGDGPLPAPGWVARAVQRRFGEERGSWDLAVLSEVDTATGAVLFIAPEAAGPVPAAIGFATDTAALNAIAFRQTLKYVPLFPALPDTVTVTNPLAIRITDDHGVPIFATAEPLDTAAASSGRLGDLWVTWPSQASLHGTAARLLVSPALPSSPLPYLGVLLALDTVILGAALWLIWRMIDLARLRSDFTSSVSHELRTPLTQILLYADMLRLDRARTPGERTRAIRIIAREGRRLLHLVENVLRFSRAERPGLALHTRPLEVRAVLTDVLDGFTPLAEAAGSVVELMEGADLTLRADEDALRRIVINLLDNAVKHGTPGTVVRVGVEPRGSMARITVDDRGPGIPEAFRSRIWEPFARVPHAGNGNGTATGSGIGLAIVRDLVRRHAGRYGVIPGPDGGSRFFVELPL